MCIYARDNKKEKEIRRLVRECKEKMDEIDKERSKNDLDN